MSQTLPVIEPQIGDEERAAVDRVLRETATTPGFESAALESELATYLGAPTCVAVSSGSTALRLGLLAARIGAGDEVVVPSFTSAATVGAVVAAGVTPVFADIDPETLCLDPRAAEAVVGPRTAALLPVHLFGQPADMTAFVRLAERHGLALVEDACHAHGAAWQGRKVGTFGAAAAFSFSRSKNMAAADGGVVVCADAATADRVRQQRGHGEQMTDVSAAMGRVQLHRLPGFNRVRRMNAALLTLGLHGVLAPSQPDEAWHVFQQYVVRSSDPARLAEHLRAAGVQAVAPYPTPVHRMPEYARGVDVPETDRAAAGTLSLPVHPGVSALDVRNIVWAVNEATRVLAA